MPPQTIVRLQVSNVKRITAVDIEPVEAVTTIGGANGAGKSSVLDSIEMAIRGPKSYPEKPIRDGEKSAKTIIDTQDFIITRTITPGGGTIVVTSKDGRKYPSPQSILDGLFGQLSFDPMEFYRLGKTTEGKRKQAEILRVQAGLDFEEMDQQKRDLYENRTLVGRDLQVAKAKLAPLAIVASVGLVELSMADLTAALQGVQAVNAANDLKRQQLTQTRDAADRAAVRCTQKIAELEAALAQERQALVGYTSDRRTAVAALDAVPARQDDTKILIDLRNLETNNAMVRSNRATVEAQKEHDKLETAYGEYTAAIDFLDAERKKKLAAAKFPVEGLSFDEAGVTMNGIPFGQLNTAQQINTSVAIGMALNPTLRVLLVREGTLLDKNSQDALFRAAEEHSFQVWIEIVTTTGEGCSVVIEDGAVKQ